MKKLYFIFFFFTFFRVQAQYHPLIRPNTYWDWFQGDGTQICGVSWGARYFFHGDTMLQGVQHKILRGYTILSTVPIPYCNPWVYHVSTISGPGGAYLREDTVAQKVYIYNVSLGADVVLYDFNLNVGDSISYTSGHTFFVDSVGTTTLANGAVRKIIYLDNDEYYIESIGGSQGLLTEMWQGSGIWGVPACVTENNVHIWEGGYCTQISADIAENKMAEAVKIYPNPAHDYFTIENNFFKPAYFTLTDLTGRTVMNYHLTGKKDNLSIGFLSPGTYLYNSEGIAGKLVVIR